MLDIIRMREVIFLGRTGETYVGPDGYTWQFTLADLYAKTTPAEWVPELPALEIWAAGQFEISREAALRITTELNQTRPWQQ